MMTLLGKHFNRVSCVAVNHIDSHGENGIIFIQIQLSE